MDIKSTLFGQLSSSADETQFIKVLINVSNELNKKGYLLNIEKKEMIKFCKNIRNNLNDKQREIWTKKVASLFGKILKQLNKLNEIKHLDFYSDKTYCGILQKFGKLNNEYYLENTILHPDFNNIKIKSVKCGGNTSIILSKNGDVYTCGDGGFGQLGHGNNNNHKDFKKVENLPPCKYISSGYAFCSVISTDGDIYTWGAGQNGRLGTGNENDCNLPVKLDLDVKFKAIESGSVHQCAISENNELYSCGDYKYNGDGNKEDKLTLTKNSFFDGIFFKKISIGPGGYHTLALNVAGNLYTWGHNRVGQLGLGHTSGSIKIDSADHIIPTPNFIEFFNNKKIIDISSGWGHSAVITSNHNVYVCGRNTKGQLGIDPNICEENIQGFPCIKTFTKIDALSGLKCNKVDCGGLHTAVKTQDGSLYLWGDNSENQLGSNIFDFESNNISTEDSYNYEPQLIDTEPYIENVINMSLGSNVTYLITQFN